MGKYKDRFDVLIKSMEKPATFMNLDEETTNTPDLQLESHFGGYPYFEEGDAWPTMKDGTPLDFVFQVFNKDEYHLPSDIKLIQLFINSTSPAWENGMEGYEIRVFSSLDFEKKILIEFPEETSKFECAKIIFDNRQTLPSSEDLDYYENEMEEVRDGFEEEMQIEMNEYYYELITEEHYGHKLGGHGNWLQYALTPSKDATLLFQIDMGWNSFYAFRDEETKEITYAFQCT